MPNLVVVTCIQHLRGLAKASSWRKLKKRQLAAMLLSRVCVDDSGWTPGVECDGNASVASETSGSRRHPHVWRLLPKLTTSIHCSKRSFCNGFACGAATELILRCDRTTATERAARAQVRNAALRQLSAGKALIHEALWPPPQLPRRAHASLTNSTPLAGSAVFGVELKFLTLSGPCAAPPHRRASRHALIPKRPEHRTTSHATSTEIFLRHQGRRRERSSKMAKCDETANI